MKKFAVCCTLLMLLSLITEIEAAEARLKGLWCTGGCCHDYKKHAPLLTEKMAQYASVEFTGLPPSVESVADPPQDFDTVFR